MVSQSEWLAHEPHIRDLSAEERRKKIFRQRKPIGAEFKAAEIDLDKEAQRRAGKESRYIGSRWLSLRMRQLVRNHYGVEFHADRHWRQRFRKRYGYSLRRASNLKRHAVAERLPCILRWHQKFRKMLSDDTDILTPDGVRQWDIVYGRFPLTHRWNFDQSLCAGADPAHPAWVLRHSVGKSGCSGGAGGYTGALVAQGGRRPPFILLRSERLARGAHRWLIALTGG